MKMSEIILNKGSIYIASIASVLLQASNQLPAGADDVTTWVSIGGGVVYIGLNMPKLFNSISNLFRKKENKK